MSSPCSTPDFSPLAVVVAAGTLRFIREKVRRRRMPIDARWRRRVPIECPLLRNECPPCAIPLPDGLGES